MNTARFEEYESCAETPKPLSRCAVTMYEAEGWGVGGSRSDDVVLHQKVECSPVVHPLDVVSTDPLVRNEAYWRGVQTNHDYGEMARVENELHVVDEEVDVYMSEINNMFSPHKYLSSSLESEMQEALISIIANVGELRQCCEKFAEKQPFISEENICQAMDQTEIIKASSGMIAAAESINKFYKTRLNTFLPCQEADAVKHTKTVSYMLDDIERIVDALESDVSVLRDKSMEAVNTLKRSLGSVSA